MGAAAFIMAEFTSIPYLEIIKYAALPAVISYVAILSVVHLQAAKTGMKPMPKEEIHLLAPPLEGHPFLDSHHGPAVLPDHPAGYPPDGCLLLHHLAIIGIFLILKAIASYKRSRVETVTLVEAVKDEGMPYGTCSSPAWTVRPRAWPGLPWPVPAPESLWGL
jgi:hypothetical protein